MGEYHMTAYHSNTFQYSELCRVATQYPMLNLKEGLQLAHSCQQQDIICLHAVVLDLA